MTDTQDSGLLGLNTSAPQGTSTGPKPPIAGGTRETTTYHMNISVRGMLNWNRTEVKRILPTVVKSDGTRFTSVEEFRNMLMDELAEGREVLPLGEACEGWDHKKGCPGHRSQQP